MLLDRLQVQFTGNQIGSGVATHYATAGAVHFEDFKTFWTELVKFQHQSVTATIPASGDVIEVETGKLQSVWSGGTFGQQSGLGTGNFPAGIGACITWITDGIVNGQRVRGRTFVVPLDATDYDAFGTLAAGTVSGIKTLALDLIAACGEDFKIYSRPTEGRDGTAHTVVDARVSNRVTSLRSRR